MFLHFKYFSIKQIKVIKIEKKFYCNLKGFGTMDLADSFESPRAHLGCGFCDRRMGYIQLMVVTLPFIVYIAVVPADRVHFKTNFISYF